MSYTCQVRLDDGSMLRLRPESWDYGIARSVLLDNEYRLPDTFDANDLIIDIGAHIGAFSHACLRRGAGRVIAFEPEPANFSLAMENLAPFAEAIDLRAEAVWRSDRPSEPLHLRSASERLNTGGHRVVSDRGQAHRVRAVSLDDVLSRLARRVSLLKIDCEGGEYPILLTASRLDLVEAIVGEFHRLGPGSVHGDVDESMRADGFDLLDERVLISHLSTQGFDVDIARCEEKSPDHSLFFARRRVTPPSLA